MNHRKEQDMGYDGWTTLDVRFTLTEIDFLYQEADKHKCSLESLIRDRTLNFDNLVESVGEAACAEGGGI
jgi:hypothetical protein